MAETSTEPKVKMRACPFCGSDARIFVDSTDNARIDCSRCHIATPWFCMSDDNAADAIAAWNRRTESSTLTAERERTRLLEEKLASCVAAVPTTWLDPLLCGPNAIELPDNAALQVERLLRAVKRRVSDIATAALADKEKDNG